MEPVILDHYGEPLEWPPRALSFSALKQMGRSPAHYRAAVTQQLVETPAMRFGTLVHAIVLGGDFAVYEGERRGNAWKAFEEEHAGRFIVTKKEYDRAAEVARAVHDDPVVRETGVLVGDREVTLKWDAHGRACRGRLDVLKPRRFITDLKLTRDAHPERFHWQARRLAYPAQMEWYAQGAAVATGHEVTDLYIVAVESSPPHLVTVHRVSDELRDQARRQIVGWLEALRVCEDSDEWPGYAQHIVPMDVLEEGDGLAWGDDEEEAA